MSGASISIFRWAQFQTESEAIREAVMMFRRRYHLGDLHDLPEDQAQQFTRSASYQCTAIATWEQMPCTVHKYWVVRNARDDGLPIPQMRRGELHERRSSDASRRAVGLLSWLLFRSRFDGHSGEPAAAEAVAVK